MSLLSHLCLFWLLCVSLLHLGLLVVVLLLCDHFVSLLGSVGPIYSKLVLLGSSLASLIVFLCVF